MIDLCRGEFEMNKKVIIYARHSLDKEMLKKSVTQLKKLAESMGEKEYEIYSEVAKLPEDNFTPEFSKIIQMIEDGKVSKIYTMNISNFHRDVKLMIKLARLMREKEVEIFENNPRPSEFTNLGESDFYKIFGQ